MAKLAVLGGEKVIESVPPVKNAGFFERRNEFTDKFTSYFGCEYGLGFDNGTSAIRAALIAAGVEAGDEVIVPSFTWPASVNPVLQIFAVPIFADIDPETFTLDPEDVKRKISRKTKAVIPVDIYGHPADIHSIMEIAKERDIIVVEDGCQATGAEIDGKKVGNIADMTAFSFSGKPITSSSGGILTTNRRSYVEKALCAGEHTSLLSSLSDKELRERYAPTLGFGYKARLDNHAAKTALEQLEILDSRNDARIEACEFLSELLRGINGLTTPRVREGCKHVFHLYTLLYDEKVFGVPRETFQKAVQAEGLYRFVTYMNSANYMNFPGGKEISCGPVHLRPVFQEKNLFGNGYPFKLAERELDYSKGSLPVTEEITAKELNIEQYAFPESFDKDKMQSYADCIIKVIDNIDELRKIKGEI